MKEFLNFFNSFVVKLETSLSVILVTFLPTVQ